MSLGIDNNAFGLSFDPVTQVIFDPVTQVISVMQYGARPTVRYYAHPFSNISNTTDAETHD